MVTENLPPSNLEMTCRGCGKVTHEVFVDLGVQPSANRYLSAAELQQVENGMTEPSRPLTVFVCPDCFLVQLGDAAEPEQLFRSDYAYFSSYSKSWLAHAKTYTDMITERLGLNESSFVVEVASNDGYLLKNFVQRGIPCLGVDPARNAAEEARKVGVETYIDFFNEGMAQRIVAERGHADLVLGNNVFAHVPDINGFVAGLHTLIGPNGIVTLEFPHFATLYEYIQFDTIYDEHYSYLSLGTVRTIFERHGLQIFDVEELDMHGGSLRVYGRRTTDEAPAPVVDTILSREADMGLLDIETYRGFQARTERIRDDFVALIEKEKAAGHRIAAFGAAAKGNTFLNYCGVERNSIAFVSDDTPFKQGRYLPGTHIPIVDIEVLKAEKPDLIVILPWNFEAEIKKRISFAAEWGARVVTAIPKVTVSAL